MSKFSNTIEYKLRTDVDLSGINKLQASLSKVQSQLTKMKFNSGGMNNAFSGFEEASRTIKEVQSALNKSFNIKVGMTDVTKLTSSLQHANVDLKRLYENFATAGSVGKVTFNNLLGTIGKVNVAMRTTSSLGDKVFNTIGNTVRWGLVAGAFETVRNSIYRAVEYIKDLDKSLNDIRIVSGQSAEQMRLFAKEANEAARNLGKTTTEFTNASLIFVQQGYNTQKSKQLAELTLKTANVTGQDTAAVSEQLTALINGYQMQGQSIEYVERQVDKLAKVAAVGAADLEELATGFSKVAAVANTLGVSTDQLTAQLSTIISVTREAPETVGNALKTIYSRLGDLKLGDTLDDGTTLGQISKNMEKVGVEVLDATGNMRNMGTIIEDLMKKWQTLSTSQKQGAAESLAGRHQYTRFMALLDNYQMYSDQLGASLESAGTLEEQQRTYMESLAGKMNALQSAEEGIINSLFNSDDIKPTIDALTTVLNQVQKIIDTVGGAGTVWSSFAATGARVISKQLGRSFSNFMSNQDLKRIARQFNDADAKVLLQSMGLDPSVNNTLSEQLIKAAQINKQNAPLMSNEQAQARNELFQQQINKVNEIEQRAAAATDKIALLNGTLQQLTGFDKEIITVGKNGIVEIDSGFQKLMTSIGVAGDIFAELTEGLNFDDARDSLEKFLIELDRLSKQVIDVGDIDEAEFTKKLRGIQREKFYNFFTEQERQELEELGKSEADVALKTSKLNKIFAQLRERFAAAGDSAEITSKEFFESAQALQAVGDSAKQAEQELKMTNTLDEQRFKLQSMATATMELVGSLGQYASSITAIHSLGRMWSDEDIDAGEKILRTVESLAFILPMLVSANSGIKTFFDSFKNNAAVAVVAEATKESSAPNVAQMIATANVSGALASRGSTSGGPQHFAKKTKGTRFSGMKAKTNPEYVPMHSNAGYIGRHFAVGTDEGAHFAQKVTKNVNILTTATTKARSAIGGFTTMVSGMVGKISVANNALGALARGFSGIFTALGGVPGILLTIASIAIPAVIGAVSGANEEAEEKLEEARQKTIDAGEEAAVKTSEINDKQVSYLKYYEDYKKTGEVTDDLRRAMVEYAETLGLVIEQESIRSDNLKEYNKVLREETVKEAYSSELDLKNAYEALKKDNKGVFTREDWDKYDFNIPNAPDRFMYVPFGNEINHLENVNLPEDMNWLDAGSAKEARMLAKKYLESIWGSFFKDSFGNDLPNKPNFDDVIKDNDILILEDNGKYYLAGLRRTESNEDYLEGFYNNVMLNSAATGFGLSNFVVDEKTVPLMSAFSMFQDGVSADELEIFYRIAAASGTEDIIQQSANLLTGAAVDLSESAGKIEENAGSMTANAESAKESIDGASTVLEDKAGSLGGAADKATTASESLDTGATNLDTGATNLDTGATNLDTGASSLNIGADTLNSGADSLNTAAIGLGDKVAQEVGKGLFTTNKPTVTFDDNNNDTGIASDEPVTVTVTIDSDHWSRYTNAFQLYDGVNSEIQRDSINNALSSYYGLDDNTIKSNQITFPEHFGYDENIVIEGVSPGVAEKLAGMFGYPEIDLSWLSNPFKNKKAYADEATDNEPTDENPATVTDSLTNNIDNIDTPLSQMQENLNYLQTISAAFEEGGGFSTTLQSANDTIQQAENVIGTNEAAFKTVDDIASSLNNNSTIIQNNYSALLGIQGVITGNIAALGSVQSAFNQMKGSIDGMTSAIGGDSSGLTGIIKSLGEIITNNTSVLNIVDTMLGGDQNPLSQAATAIEDGKSVIEENNIQSGLVIDALSNNDSIIQGISNILSANSGIISGISEILTNNTGAFGSVKQAVENNNGIIRGISTILENNNSALDIVSKSIDNLYSVMTADVVALGEQAGVIEKYETFSSKLSGDREKLVTGVSGKYADVVTILNEDRNNISMTLGTIIENNVSAISSLGSILDNNNKMLQHVDTLASGYNSALKATANVIVKDMNVTNSLIPVLQETNTALNNYNTMMESTGNEDQQVDGDVVADAINIAYNTGQQQEDISYDKFGNYVATGETLKHDIEETADTAMELITDTAVQLQAVSEDFNEIDLSLTDIETNMGDMSENVDNIIEKQEESTQAAIDTNNVVAEALSEIKYAAAPVYGQQTAPEEVNELVNAWANEQNIDLSTPIQSDWDVEETINTAANKVSDAITDWGNGAGTYDEVLNAVNNAMGDTENGLTQEQVKTLIKTIFSNENDTRDELLISLLEQNGTFTPVSPSDENNQPITSSNSNKDEGTGAADEKDNTTTAQTESDNSIAKLEGAGAKLISEAGDLINEAEEGLANSDNQLVQGTRQLTENLPETVEGILEDLGNAIKDAGAPAETNVADVEAYKNSESAKTGVSTTNESAAKGRGQETKTDTPKSNNSRKTMKAAVNLGDVFSLIPKKPLTLARSYIPTGGFGSGSSYDYGGGQEKYKNPKGSGSDLTESESSSGANDSNAATQPNNNSSDSNITNVSSSVANIDAGKVNIEGEVAGQQTDSNEEKGYMVVGSIPNDILVRLAGTNEDFTKISGLYNEYDPNLEVKDTEVVFGEKFARLAETAENYADIDINNMSIEDYKNLLDFVGRLEELIIFGSQIDGNETIDKTIEALKGTRGFFDIGYMKEKIQEYENLFTGLLSSYADQAMLSYVENVSGFIGYVNDRWEEDEELFSAYKELFTKEERQNMLAREIVNNQVGGITDFATARKEVLKNSTDSSDKKIIYFMENNGGFGYDLNNSNDFNAYYDALNKAGTNTAANILSDNADLEAYQLQALLTDDEYVKMMKSDSEYNKKQKEVRKEKVLKIAEEQKRINDLINAAIENRLAADTTGIIKEEDVKKEVDSAFALLDSKEVSGWLQEEDRIAIENALAQDPVLNIYDLLKAARNERLNDYLQASEVERKQILSDIDNKKTIEGNFAEVGSIAGNLKTGDTISEESYAKLIDDLGKESLDGYFSMMADGTYQLIGDAKEFYNAVTESSRQAMFDNISKGVDTNNVDMVRSNSEELLSTAGNLGELDALRSQVSSMIPPGEGGVFGYSEALIQLASQYENCTKEIKEYQEALESNDLSTIKTAEDTLRASITIGELSKTYNLAADDVETHARLLKDSADGYELTEEQAARLAVANRRMNRGVKTLNENFEDWIKILKSGDHTTMDYADTLNDAFDALADLTGALDASTIPADFLDDTLDSGAQHLEWLGQAAQGDVQAINLLGSSLAIANVETMEADKSFTSVLNGWKNMSDDQVTSTFDNLKSVVVDAMGTIHQAVQDGLSQDEMNAMLAEMGDDWILKLNAMAKATGMSVDEMNSLLGQLGVQAKVDVEYVQQEMQVPTYTTYETVSEESPADEKTGKPAVWKKESYTVPGAPVTVQGFVPVAQISTDANNLTPDITYGGTGGSYSGGGISPSSLPRSSGGGGGGGGGGDSYTPKKQKHVEEDKNLYEYVDTKLEDIQQDLSLIADEQDRLVGDKLASNINKQLKLTQKQIDYEREKLKIMQQEAATLRDRLAEEAGAVSEYDEEHEMTVSIDAIDVVPQYDEEGFLTNYAEMFDAHLRRINGLIDLYNQEATEDGQERIQLMIDLAKEQFENFKSDVSRYDTLIGSEMNNIRNQIEQDYDAMEDLHIEALHTAIEAVESIQKVKEAMIDFNAVFTGIDSSDPFRNASVGLQKLGLYFDRTGKSAEKFYNDLIKSARAAAEAATDEGERAAANARAETYEQARQMVALRAANGELFGKTGTGKLDYSLARAQLMSRLINDYETTGESKIYRENSAQLYEDAQEAFDELTQDWQDFESGIEDMSDSIMEMIETIAETGKQYTTYLDELNDALDQAATIIELIRGDDYSSQIKVAQDKITNDRLAMQANDYTLAKLNELLENEKQFIEVVETSFDKNGNTVTRQVEVVNPRWQAIHEQQVELQQDSSKRLQQIVENTQAIRDAQANLKLDRFMTDIGLKAIDANGNAYTVKDKNGNSIGDLEWANEQWELINRNEDQYLDDVNRAVETQKLQNKYQEMLNDSTDPGIQRQITEQMKQQLTYLREKNQLSKYDVEYANAQLDILQKRIALEEAQRNKSTLKLRRDGQGNYSYVYTADQNAIDNAENDLLDAELNAYNLAKNNSIETQANALSALQQFREQMYSIITNNTLTAEEQTERIQFLAQNFKNFMAGNFEQLNTSTQQAFTEAMELAQMLMDENQSNILTMIEENTNATSEQLSAIDDRFNSSVTSWMTTEETFKSSVDTLVNGLAETAQEYEDVINGVGKNTTNIFNSITDSIKDTETSTASLINTQKQFFDLLDEQGGITDGYIKSLNEIQKQAFENSRVVNSLKETISDLEEQLNQKNLEEANIPITLGELQNPSSGAGKGTGDGSGNGEGGNGSGKGGSDTDQVNIEYSNGTIYPNDVLIEGLAGNIWYIGSWDNDPNRRQWLSERFGDEIASAVQSYINHVRAGQWEYSHDLDSMDYYRQFNIDAFDTGGYTGDWDNSGRIAMLHQKELVLNKHDTENMLEAVKTLRDMQIASAMDNSAANFFKTGIHNIQSILSGEQQVHIEASFPGVQTAIEIQNALLGLANQASHHMWEDDKRRGA